MAPTPAAGPLGAGPRAGSATHLLLLAVWLLATLGLRPLLLPDEGRYATVAREMLSGDALVPTLNGLPFFHKPPLFYWLDMAAMQGFGPNAFAARFGAALGAWLLGAALYLHLRRWHSQPMATVGLVVLATCPLFFVSAQYANHDMLVAGLTTAAILAFVRALEMPDRVHPGWLVAAWFGCGLAMLAKGLIGFVLPALVVGPWLLAQGRFRQTFKLLHPLAVLAGLAVAAPWFIAMQARYPGFNGYFFMEQHFRRFAETSFNNVQPFWFFLALLPVLTLPWSAWLPQAVRRGWQARDPRTGLYAWWVVAVVGFFSLPSSKLAGYILPALAPWCALLALELVQARPLWRKRMACLGATLCIGTVVAIAWKSPTGDRNIAHALAAQMAPGDRVVMLDEYLSDIPFYAQLHDPVLVLGNWSDPQLQLHDNWRKELVDAAAFDSTRGHAVLRPLSELGQLPCGSGTWWFVTRKAQAPEAEGLAGVTPVMQSGDTRLWRAPASACH